MYSACVVFCVFSVSVKGQGVILIFILLSFFIYLQLGAKVRLFLDENVNTFLVGALGLVGYVTSSSTF